MLENERCRANAAPTSATRLVAILALAAFVNMMGALALGPFLPVVADDLGTSVALLGQVPSLMMLLAALLGLAIGPLADRYGFRWTLVIGLLTVAIGALGTALTTGRASPGGFGNRAGWTLRKQSVAHG